MSMTLKNNKVAHTTQGRHRKPILSKQVILQKLIGLVLILLLSVSIKAQDTLRWYARSHALASTNELVPLWLHTNRFGTVNNFGNGELSLIAGQLIKQISSKILI